MTGTARGMALLLSGSVLLSGCLRAERWAERARERIAPGMSSEEVRDEIGDPVAIMRGASGQPEMWLYQYESGAGTAVTILIVVLVVGLIVLALAAGNGSFGFAGCGVRGDVAEFRVQLDGAGKVVGVSPIVVFPKP
jgi:hypothetical protein